MTRRVSSTRLQVQELEGRDVPATVFAVGTGLNANHLYQFDTATPGTIAADIPVTGLAAGEVLVGTGFRPGTGQLYGVGVDAGTDTVTLYLVDPRTGVATAVRPPSPGSALGNITGATAWGVDFNPAANYLQLVNNLPGDGAGTNVNSLSLSLSGELRTAVDPDFTGLPGGAANAPEVAVAYTAAGSGFGIVSGGDRLVSRAGTISTEVLTDVGPLGVDTGDNAGLAVFATTAGGSVVNRAVAVLTVGGVPRLYEVDLATGAASLVGTVGDGSLSLGDITVAEIPAPVVAGGATDGTAQLIRPGSVTPLTPFAGSAANVRATTGDVNGDGIADVIAVTGPGTPIRVTVVSGADNATVLVPAFDPFGGDFTGGGFVAAGDFDNDGRAEFVVTPDQGGGPRVSMFSLPAGGTVTPKLNFFGIDDPNFRGGARVAAGDLDGNGVPDLVVAAGFGGGPRVAVFNGGNLLLFPNSPPTRLVPDFYAFPGADAATLRNGVYVAAGDVDGDGLADLIFGGGPGGAPRVFVLSGAVITTGRGVLPPTYSGDVAGAQTNPLANFFVAGNTTDRGGVRVAVTDRDGDNRADVVVGSGEGNPARVRIYPGRNLGGTGEPTGFEDTTVFNGATLPGGVFVG
jgi:hypothetical protein